MQKDSKRKLMMVMTITAFAFLGWQVSGLMHDHHVAPTVVSSTEVASSAQSNAMPALQAPAVVATTAESNSNRYVQPANRQVPDAAVPVNVSSYRVASTQTHENMQVGEVSELPVAAQSAASAMSSAMQTEYLRLMSQFELAKLQHQLLNEQVEIARDRQQIATLNHQITDLSKDSNVASDTESDVMQDRTVQIGQPEYQLVYLDEQNGQWTATLKDKGEYEAVTAGSVLPQGEHVLAINGMGLTIDKGDEQTFRLTFQGMQKIESAAVLAQGPDKKSVVDKVVHAEQTELAANEQHLIVEDIQKPEDEKMLSDTTPLAAFPPTVASAEPSTLESTPTPVSPSASIASSTQSDQPVQLAQKTTVAQQITTQPDASTQKFEKSPATNAQVMAQNEPEFQTEVAAMQQAFQAQNTAVDAARIPDQLLDEDPADPSDLQNNLAPAYPPTPDHPRKRELQLFPPLANKKPLPEIPWQQQRQSVPHAAMAAAHSDSGTVNNPVVVANLQQPLLNMSLLNAGHSMAAALKTNLVTPQNLHDFSQKSAPNMEVMPPPLNAHFALQLIASNQLQSLHEFVQAHHLESMARLARVEQQDKAWFVVVYGNFVTRAAAQNALKILPKSLRKLQPWPRILANLQWVEFS